MLSTLILRNELVWLQFLRPSRLVSKQMTRATSRGVHRNWYQNVPSAATFTCLIQLFCSNCHARRGARAPSAKKCDHERLEGGWIFSFNPERGPKIDRHDRFQSACICSIYHGVSMVSRCLKNQARVFDTPVRELAATGVPVTHTVCLWTHFCFFMHVWQILCCVVHLCKNHLRSWCVFSPWNHNLNATSCI